VLDWFNYNFHYSPTLLLVVSFPRISTYRSVNPSFSLEMLPNIHLSLIHINVLGDRVTEFLWYT